MNNLRTEVWDHLYRTGPQSVEQISNSLQIDRETVCATIDNEWFENLDTRIRIAIKPTVDSHQGRIR